MTRYKKYIKNRSRETLSRVAVFIPIIPTIYPLPPLWSVFLVFVSIVIIGTPDDKIISAFKRN